MTEVAWWSYATASDGSSPGTKASRSTGQVVPASTVVNITFDVADFDDLGWWDPADPTQIVVDRDCRLLVGIAMGWKYPVVSGFVINVGVESNNGGVPNTGVPVCSAFIGSAVAGHVNAGFCSTVVAAAAGDTFALYAFQTSATNQTTWFPGAVGADTQVSPALFAQVV